jgi:hypothetical protein
MATSFSVAGCSTPKLPNNQTASEQFSRLGYAENGSRELRIGNQIDEAVKRSLLDTSIWDIPEYVEGEEQK